MNIVRRNDQSQTSGLLNDPSARTLVAGDLEAVILPDHGMLGASLRYKGVEILRRVEDLEKQVEMLKRELEDMRRAMRRSRENAPQID